MGRKHLMAVLPLSALFYQQINLATSCILANLSANGDTLTNKRGHAATEEEKPMISVPSRWIEDLGCKEIKELVECTYAVVCTWFHQFPGHCKFFSQSTANQWSIKCQAFSKNRIFGHNNCNLSDGNGKEFEKHWHRIAVKKPFPSHRDETLLACDWGVDESFTTFTWFDPAGPSNDF